MMAWLTDPRAFNCVIMGLYVLAAIWWAKDGKWWDVAYWLCAFGLTVVVTFGYRR